MKVNELLDKAKEELKSEEEMKVLQIIKNSLRNIESAKKTLKRLEEHHKKLLDTEVSEIELDNYAY